MAAQSWSFILGAILLTLLAAATVTVMTVADSFGGPGFTPEGWRAEAGEIDPLQNDRVTMVSEVLDRLTPGTSRDEVLALLGPADSEADGVLVYEIGVAPFGVDTEALRVTFDANGRMTAARIDQR